MELKLTNALCGPEIFLNVAYPTFSQGTPYVQTLVGGFGG